MNSSFTPIFLTPFWCFFGFAFACDSQKNSGTIFSMNTSLFRPPISLWEEDSFPVSLPRVEGMKPLSEKQETSFLLSGEESAAHSVFFQFPKSAASKLSFSLSPSAKRLLFFRSESLASSDISLHFDLQENTKSIIVFSFLDAPSARQRLRFSASLGENAHFSLLFFHLSQSEFFGDFSVHHKGSDSESYLSYSEIGTQQAKSDVFLQSVLSAKRCRGNIATTSVLSGSAFSRIQGIPIVEQGAEQGECLLDQKNLLLSAHARSESVPMLSVQNNHVRAAHRSSTIRLSEEDLFYCASRGISQKDAEYLLLDGLLEMPLSHIPDAGIQKCVRENVHHFLHHHAYSVIDS